MAVPEQLPIVSYVANGATGRFNITFDLSDERFLVVTVNNEIPPVGTYIIQDEDVVFASIPEAGTIITLARDTDLERETTYSRYDNSFNPAALNWDLDKLWHVLQEQNLVDAKILARIKSEIEWRRTHDFNYDELAQVREKQQFDALKGYSEALLASANPGVFQGVIAGVVFAQDGKSIQTHLEEILESLVQERESIKLKAEKTYVDEQLLNKQEQIDSKAPLAVTDNLQEQKVDKTYFDTTLSSFQNGAIKTYPTLAAANADIANIALNTKVSVLSSTEGGDYYKASADATSLTKSAYDPKAQAIAEAKNYVSNNGDARIISANPSNINYNIADRTLTFTDTVYVFAHAQSATIATPQTLTLSGNTTYRIEYNFSSNTLRAVIYTAAKADGWLVCGYIATSATDAVTSDFVYKTNGTDTANYELGRVVTSSPTTVNLSTDTGFLIVRANGRVVSSVRAAELPASSAALPALNGAYRVEYNSYDKTIEINISSSAVKKGNVFFATLTLQSGAYSLFGIDVYSINGVAANAAKAASAGIGVLLGQSPSDIDFDFVAQTLTIKNQAVRYLQNGKTRLLSGQVLDLSGDVNRWHSLVVTSSNTLEKRVTTLPNNEDDVVVGQLRVGDRQVHGIPYFTIQGKLSGAKSELKTADFLVPFGNVEPDYTQPELPDYSAMRSENAGDYNKFYALYDALATAYPKYITKTVLGADALGNPINQYQFTTPEVPTASATSLKPKVILISGVHGGEKAGMYNVYFALKQVIERWKQDDHLAALYWGVNFIVVPVANPSGYNANTRWNHNNVDIARNFAADWSAALERGGSAPFSEPETVILDAVISNNRDAIYVCSHHNFGDNSSNFIWNASASYFSRTLAKNLIIGQTIRSKKRYAWMSQADNYYIGYTDLGQPPASEGRQALDKYGMNASTFEISSSFAWEAGMPVYSSAVATIGVESFINWLLMNIKYAPQLYNTRINL